MPSIGWTGAKVVSPTGYDPSLAVGSDGRVHIVWEDIGIYYRSYAPRKGWTAIKVVSTEGYDPSLAIGPDGTVHIAWAERVLDGPFSIVYRKFKPNSVWPPPEVVAITGYDLINPCLGVASDGTIHIVWNLRYASMEVGIPYRRYEPGTGWTGIEHFPGVVSKNPSLAVGPDGTAHVVWQWGWEDDAAILHRSYEPGTGWETQETVSPIPISGPPTWWVLEANPSLAVGPDGAVHVAWVDSADYRGSGGDVDIFCKSYLPNIGWTVAEVVSTESSADSSSPSLAVGPDGTVHIAWVDQTDYRGSGTDADIFYKKLIGGKSVLGVIDQVDIGDTESEIGHCLWGWGPTGGYYYLSPDFWSQFYRTAWYSNEGASTWDRAGIVTLHRREGSVIKDLYLRVLDRFGIESFDVYVQVSWGKSWTGWQKVYHYDSEADGYYWVIHRVQMPECWRFAAKVKVAIVAGGELEDRELWNGLGRVDWIALAGYIKF